MNVLVTGGAGSIGSHAARALVRKGHTVVLYDNLSTGDGCLAAGLELVVGDTANAPSLM
ncbi:MAG: NAD-dependent epimerase/dehydratase family protein [Acidobacteriia bacterium]|nr:NAD-dependent epimerase/dehydratase family protein [Terriglobia bacterium]